jgi:hypothetical protein
MRHGSRIGDEIGWLGTKSYERRELLAKCRNLCSDVVSLFQAHGHPHFSKLDPTSRLTPSQTTASQCINASRNPWRWLPRTRTCRRIAPRKRPTPECSPKNENVVAASGVHVLSKWLERRPPTAYPWAMARQGSADKGGGRNTEARAKFLFQKRLPHPEQPTKWASRRMRRAGPEARPRPSRRLLRKLLRMRALVL